MAQQPHFRIGIDPRIGAGPLTGIGNYTLALLQALTEEFPALDYRLYQKSSWKCADEATLILAANSQRKDVPSKHLLLGANFKRTLRNKLSRNPLAKYAYDSLIFESRRRRFEKSVQQQNLHLFHAFNFIPIGEPAVPTIPVVYDLSFIRYPHTHPYDRLKRLASLSKVIDRAPVIHTISEFSKTEISNVYGVEPDRIFVAPPAARSIFAPKGSEVTNRDLSVFDLTYRNYFLAVGTLEPRKNLKTLIEAYSRLTRRERQAAPLVVVGGQGWGNIELPALSAAMQRDGSLMFLGSVPDTQLRSLYEGALTLLFPSIYEGFGMPVVEAFSCGTPAVHGANTSMSEISQHLAIEINAESSDDWLDAMRGFLDNKNIDQAKQHQLVRRANQYSWRSSAQTVYSAYCRSLSFGRGS